MAVQTYTGSQGSRLHYELSGQGAPLLLIHGSLCDYRYWRWQIPAFSQGWQVVAPSLRGFWPEAFTQADDSFSIAQHCRDMQDLIRTISPGQPVHVLGHSRGAQVAVELACSSPELVRSLILADPGFRILGEPETTLFHSQAVALLERGEAEAGLATFIDSVNGADTWRHMVSWFKTMVRDNAYTLLSQIRETNLAVDLNQLAGLRCPVQLIGGANSPARFGSRLDALENVMQHAVRVSIPLASHGMNLGNPKAFNQAVAEFLETA